MTRMIYLASPYSHEDKDIRQMRFTTVCIVAAKLLNKGLLVFSPIAHTHWIAVYGQLETGFNRWRELDEAMIDRCTEMYVLCIQGWKESKGVQHEIQYANDIGLPVKYIDLSGNEIEVC